MKLFKHIALAAILTVGAFSAVMYSSSCTKDKCKDVTCQNGGVCSDGVCTCAIGYEGTNCETASRAKFVKSWTASDTRVADGHAEPTYVAPIAAGTTIVDVKIGNFWGSFTHDVIGTVSGNVITVPSQQPDGDMFYVEGTGTYDAATNKINWSYKITDPTSVQQSYTGSWQ